MAAIIKHFHVWMVVLSVGGFFLRFLWSQTNSSYLRNKWARIAPHIIDTLLLASGIALAIMLGFSPHNSQWLTAKLILIVVYIGLGYTALKMSLSRPVRLASGGLALLAVVGIIFCAVYKPVFV